MLKLNISINNKRLETMTGRESGKMYSNNLVVMMWNLIYCKMSHSNFVNNKMLNCSILTFCAPPVDSRTQPKRHAQSAVWLEWEDCVLYWPGFSCSKHFVRSGLSVCGWLLLFGWESGKFRLLQLGCSARIGSWLEDWEQKNCRVHKVKKLLALKTF